MLRTGAEWLAARDPLPTSLRAVLGYYADAGVIDTSSLRLKRHVDDVTEGMIDDAFGAVERRLADAFDADVSFDYDTKLVLPAQLTFGYLHRRVDGADRERAEAVTRLVVEALIDGDMRDAINDDEFGDFAVDADGGQADRRRAAELAQATLQERVEAGFAEFPDGVRAAYERAVAVSEAHQAEDDRFRELMRAAREGDPAARERIETDYRDADFVDPPGTFAATGRDLPYLRTQYERVGVIYDGMIGMYRAAGFDVEEAFETSIVLAIVGAQIWLDDVDDYAADMREDQLTPVTAEYLLAPDESTARRRVIRVARQYLDLAKDHAARVDSPLTGIATEYIYRSGRPETLPGGDVSG
ncbi:MAG: hypothetical protein ABEH56_00560 [Salinirussus sp.]